MGVFRESRNGHRPEKYKFKLFVNMSSLSSLLLASGSQSRSLKYQSRQRVPTDILGVSDRTATFSMLMIQLSIQDRAVLILDTHLTSSIPFTGCFPFASPVVNPSSSSSIFKSFYHWYMLCLTSITLLNHALSRCSIICRLAMAVKRNRKDRP